MEKVSIIGSGNVGANTAFFMAEKGITDVVLYDINEGAALGKALDMMEAAPIRKYRNRITGSGDIAATADSEAVVIAAGRGCAAGADTESLLDANWNMVRGIVERIMVTSPHGIIIVATEPVDLIISLLSREFAIPRARLMGLGGLIDAARIKSAVSRKLLISSENITAMVIGRHSEEMIALTGYTRVSGIPLKLLMDEKDIELIIDEAREGGRTLAELAECPGTYYTPSAAAADVVDAVHMDMKRIMALAVELKGEYGLDGMALSLPCVVGKSGVERVMTPELTTPQLSALHRSARVIKDITAGYRS